MGIIRWLLCHSLTIVFLILLVLLFSIRGDIKDDYIRLVGGSAPAQANTLKVQANNAVELENKTEKVLPEASSKTLAETASTVRPDRVENDPWSEVFNGVNSPSAAGKYVDDPGSVSKFPPENYDPESAVLDESTLLPVTPVESGRQLSSMDSSSTKRQVPANKEYFTALEEARRLYWQGQVGLAQAAYERLMFKYQDLPEAAEELGNLLLQQGNKNGATWAYKNAIPRYLNLHREQEAISIMTLLSQYDPVTAEKLQKKYW